MTWTAGQLQQHQQRRQQQQQQQQQQEAAWLINMRGMGLSMLDMWICCRGVLKMLEAELRDAPLVRKFATLLLPAAKLAWALVEAAPSAATNCSSSSSSGLLLSSSSSSGRHPRSAPPGVVPAAMMSGEHAAKHFTVFATHFGPFAMREIAKGPMSPEALKSDELLQVLLLYIACTAASLQQQQTRATGSSSSSSRRSRQAADAPAHRVLLAALAPVLQQLRSDDQEGWASSNDLATWAPFALGCIATFLLQRTRALQPAAAAIPGLSSQLQAVSSASSAQAAVDEGMQGASVLPRDQLLLPLLLTIVELTQLAPSGQHLVVQYALPFMVGLIEHHCPQLGLAARGIDSLYSSSGGDVSAPSAPEDGQTAAVADGLAEPLLLQLAPAVLQCMREQADEGGRVTTNYLLLLRVVLRNSGWLGLFPCWCTEHSRTTV
jgi:hypothetical protein